MDSSLDAGQDPTGVAVPESVRLEISAISKPNGTSVVSPVGEIDSATADSFGAALDQELSRTDRYLIIDLTGVTFMSSAGLSQLVSTDEAGQDRGIAVAVVASHRVVRRPIEACGLQEALTLYDDIATALADSPT